MSNLQEKAKKFSEKHSNGKHFRDLEFGYENGFSDCQKEYEEKLRWISIAEPPKKAELIILEYSGCSNSKKYVVYDFDPEYFEGVFHINGVAERWRSFL